MKRAYARFGYVMSLILALTQDSLWLAMLFLWAGFVADAMDLAPRKGSEVPS